MVKFLHWWFGHLWQYRNPAARKCSYCGRSQNLWTWGYDAPLYSGEWQDNYNHALDSNQIEGGS